MLRRGLTLRENMLFLTVALALIMNGTMFFRQVQASQQTVDTLRVTVMLVENLSEFARGRGYYDISNRVAIDHEMLPRNYTRGNDLVSGYGGRMNVLSPIPFDRFSIELDDISGIACKRMMEGGSEIRRLRDRAIEITVNGIEHEPERGRPAPCRPRHLNIIRMSFR